MKAGLLNIVPESSPRIMRTLYWSLALIGIFFFQHVDIAQTAPQGVMLLEAVRQGEWRHFYSFVAGRYVMPSYHIVFYFVFGLWNLPLYLLGTFFPVLLELHIVVMWSKLLLALCLLLAGKLISIAAADAGYATPEQVKYDLLWSPLIFYFVFYFGGCEILTVVLLLWALHFYLKWDILRFTLVISLAVCFKYFALIVFLPMLFFEEKRPLRLIGYTVLAILPAVLTTLPFLGDPAIAVRGAFEQGFLLRFMGQRLPFVPSGIPLFPLIYLLLLYFSYTRSPRGESRRQEYAFFLPLLTLSSLFAFGAMHLQWLVLLAPLWGLCMISLPQERIRKIFFLQGILFLALCGLFAVYHTNGSDQRMIQESFAGQWIGTNSPMHALETRDLFGIGEPFLCGYWTVYAAALLLLAYELRPGKEGPKEPLPPPVFSRCLLLRFAVLAFYVIPVVFSFGFSKRCETQIAEKYGKLPGLLGWSLCDEDSAGMRPGSLDVFAHSNSPVYYSHPAVDRRFPAEELAENRTVVIPLPPLKAPAAGFDIALAPPPQGIGPGETELLFSDAENRPLFQAKLLHPALNRNRYYRVLFPKGGLNPARVVLRSRAPSGHAPFLKRFSNGEADCRMVLSRQ